MAQKKKKKTGCIIAIVITLLLIIAVIVAAVKGMSVAMQMMKTTTYGTVEIKDLSSYVNVNGSVSSNNSVNVTSELSQKVLRLYVKAGDSVKKGDLLCELDTAALQEQYDALVLSMGKAKSLEDYKMSLLYRELSDAQTAKSDALRKAQQTVDQAVQARDDAYLQYNTTVDNYNQLIGEIDAADPETAEELQAQADALAAANAELFPQLSVLDEAVGTAYEAYQATEKEANAMIQTAQDAVDQALLTADDDSGAELKKLQEQIDSCKITAPSDGVITQLNIAEGSIPMGTVLMTIEDTDDLVIRGKVSEADILRIAEGMDCEIKTSATEEAVISGTVRRIERVPSTSVGEDGAVSGYAVEIGVSDPESKLLIGMSASVKIILNKAEDVLSVPYDAVNGGENEGYFVYVCEPTDSAGVVKVVKKQIEIGFEGDYYTEVISGDLKEGDIVLTSNRGIDTVEEGAVIPDPTLTDKD